MVKRLFRARAYIPAKQKNRLELFHNMKVAAMDKAEAIDKLDTYLKEVLSKAEYDTIAHIDAFAVTHDDTVLT